MAKEKYQWDNYFDGKEHILEKGLHFEIEAIDMRSMAYQAASRKGKCISATILRDGDREFIRISPRRELVISTYSSLDEALGSETDLLERPSKVNGSNKVNRLSPIQKKFADIENAINNGDIIVLNHPKDFTGSARKAAEKVLAEISRLGYDLEDFEFDYSNRDTLKVYCGIQAENYRQLQVENNLAYSKRIGDLIPITSEKVVDWLGILQKESYLKLKPGKDFSCSVKMARAIIEVEAAKIDLNLDVRIEPNQLILTMRDSEGKALEQNEEYYRPIRQRIKYLEDIREKLLCQEVQLDEDKFQRVMLLIHHKIENLEFSMEYPDDGMINKHRAEVLEKLEERQEKERLLFNTPYARIEREYNETVKQLADYVNKSDSKLPRLEYVKPQLPNNSLELLRREVENE